MLTPPVNDIDIVNSYHNLATDGVSLYWQSAQSVSTMPIGGGPITTLDPTRPNTPTAGVYLNGRTSSTPTSLTSGTCGPMAAR